MSSLRRIGPIVAVAAAVLLAAGCGGGKKETATATTTAATESSSSSSAPALDPDKTYTVTLKTNQGTFAFDLDVKSSPHTTASFAALVKKRFFDGLTFHRIVPGFVIQGGDPEGNGMGGPGYSVVDAPPQDTKYEKGLVAMAKTQTDPAGTSGSQFFVVSGDGVNLPPDYAVLGHVTDGMDVVEKIGKLGNPADPSGTPTEKVTIDKMELESG
jgi:peptidyl-prolyl cis-trans isomerase B (cyclophilin B)